MSTIGLDLGTTGVRAVSFDAAGREISAASRRTQLTKPRDGWLEFDPEAVLISSERVVAEAAAAAAAANDPVTAIGFSSQGEAIVPVDGRGRALAAAPVGMDSRGEPAARFVAAQVGAMRVQQITGQPLNRMFSVYRIAVGDQAWRPPRASGYRTLADFIAARWGAAPATDWTAAARTGMFDVNSASWSDELIAVVAEEAPWIADVHLSEPVAPGTPLGPVTTAADRLGVRPGTLLVAGIHDQAASFIGAGGRAGAVSIFALGSSDCLTVETTRRPAGIIGTGFATYQWRPDHWLTLAGTAAGGWALDWYVDLLGKCDPAELITDLANEPPSLIVLPHLAGSNTLDNDPTGSGAIIGLTLDTTRAELTRAFLEAAGYELDVLVEAFTAEGLTVGDIRAVGTGATSSASLAVRTSASGLSLTPAGGQASARGAALIAAAAIGTADLDELPPPETGTTLHPEPATSGWYAQQRRVYRQLHQTLRALHVRPIPGSDPS